MSSRILTGREMDQQRGWGGERDILGVENRANKIEAEGTFEGGDSTRMVAPRDCKPLLRPHGLAKDRSHRFRHR